MPLDQDNPKSPELRSCCECGDPFTITDPARQHNKRFCSDAHAQAFANRLTTQGKAMAAFVKAWRLKRGSGDLGKAALAEMCQIVDGFNEEDRKAGRPPVTDYVESVLKQGYRYIDRKSWRPKKAA